MMYYYLISLVVVILDQLSKQWTVLNLELYEQLEVIPGVLSLTHIHNTGAAWSILEGKMWFFYLITVIVIVGIVYYMQKNKTEKLLQVALALILGGAIGNFIDRLVYQYVIDMIQLDFIDFPIFNLADTALTIGVILIFIHMLFFDRSDEEQVG